MAEPFTLNPATPASEPDPGLSYERDIAPLQQRFFRQIYGNRSIRPQDRAAISMGLSQQLGSAFEQQAKFRDVDQQARNRELSFKTGLFALEQAREKAVRERENLTALSGVTSQLLDITNSYADDPEAQKKLLSQWGVQNAGALATNDAAKIAFDSAVRGLGRPKTNYTEEDLLRMGVPFDELDTNKDGVVSEDERTPMGVSRVLVGQRRLARETELGEKQLTEKARTDREAAERRQKLADMVVGQLGGIRFKTSKDIATGVETELPDFADAASEATVSRIISTIGGPEAAAAAKAAKTGRERFDIANRLGEEYLRGQLGVATPTRPSATGLFSTPK
jgi:hypothetical protein